MSPRSLEVREAVRTRQRIAEGGLRGLSCLRAVLLGVSGPARPDRITLETEALDQSAMAIAGQTYLN